MAEPVSFANLIAGGWKEAAFGPFRPGVDMCRLAGDPEGASVALLRYEPGARVPLHEHMGIETILVLDGVQYDDRGRYEAGSMVVNPAGSQHRVWSDEGCVVLILWEKPVRILEE